AHQPRHHDPVAILHVEALHRLAVGAIEQAPVGEHAVDVEDEQLYCAGPGGQLLLARLVRARAHDFSAWRMARTSVRTRSNSGKDSEQGPSQSARSGSSWTSVKSASIPAAA